ncbi:hypothetical protein KZ813_10245 [Sphingomonas sp. RHCKR7]|uniref:hypothetical protein n=1 Tax=Sphingomonas folli TaxID=2862497 RepID=UPI001CA55674|nr:hypothetical protein [Sphingomonas folli]MBW6527219.1 hypothetical protein [Sphingomonas folli]
MTHFSMDTLTGYQARSPDSSEKDKSFDYLILHELAHNTEAGKAENEWQTKNGTNDADGYYLGNEVLANSLAKAIEDDVGLKPLSSPTYGYDGNAVTSSASVNPSPTETTKVGGTLNLYA